MTTNPNPVPHAYSTAAGAPGGEMVLDRYRLERRIGAGGMGVVFLAHDERLGREVAVKRVVLDSDPDARAEREAIAAARLSHPAIVALYEIAHDGEAVYLVSELVRGMTLRALLSMGELSDREILRIGATLCDALAHAHARGVIHRDVKPANVLCPDEPDAGGIAKLADFGIARLADGDALTMTGDVIGTLAYMAPEQARGGPITPAVDVYSLALVLYEALTGLNPVRGENAGMTARRVGMRIPPLRRVRRDLPAPLCRAIDAALAPDPQQRAGLAELRAGLSGSQGVASERRGIVTARPSPSLTWTRPRERARPAPAAVPAPAGEDVAPPAPGLAARLAGRLAAGAAAGALGGVALAQLGPAPPVEPTAAGALVGIVVAVLPRLGWVAAVGALVTWLAGVTPGLALLAAAAALPVVVVLPRSGVAWSGPACAPVLGLAGLAGAWPALAGQARSWPARAGLGAVGFWWLGLAELLGGDRLLLGEPGSARPRGAFEDSTVDAARDALWPLLSSGALAVAALWALAAVLLPVLVRGRSAAIDAVGATAWAAGLAAGTSAIAGALAVSTPRGLIVGPAVGAVVAVAARALRARA